MKTSVLTALLALSLPLVAVAGFATYRHWAWLEQYHLAGLAALETFFALVAAVRLHAQPTDGRSDLALPHSRDTQNRIHRSAAEEEMLVSKPPAAAFERVLFGIAGGQREAG